MTATREHFFKTKKGTSPGKNGRSEHRAMQMAADDAAARVLKTERLKKLREASIANAQAATPQSMTSETG